MRWHHNQIADGEIWSILPPKEEFSDRIERRKFFTRNQKPEETIDGYITELRNLSSTCEFQDIRERVYKLVDGIESS